MQIKDVNIQQVMIDRMTDPKKLHEDLKDIMRDPLMRRTEEVNHLGNLTYWHHGKYRNIILHYHPQKKSIDVCLQEYDHEYRQKEVHFVLQENGHHHDLIPVP